MLQAEAACNTDTTPTQPHRNSNSTLRTRQKSIIAVTIRKNTPIRNLDTATITLPDSKFDIMHTCIVFLWAIFDKVEENRAHIPRQKH